jgi:hypothetical protein
MGDHLRLRLSASLVAAVVAAASSTVLAPLPTAALLIGAAALAGALLGRIGALFALPLLFFADGVTAKVAVLAAGALAVAAVYAQQRWTAPRIGRHVAPRRVDRPAAAGSAVEPLPDRVAEITQEWSTRTGVGVILHSAGLDDGDTAPWAAAELLWILGAALDNVAAHASAETVAVTLGRDGDEITLEVRDDGIGFAAPDSLADLPPEGFRGLAGMQERARLAGGHVQVWSRQGGGTRIAATVPAVVATGAAQPSGRVRLIAAVAAAVVPLAFVMALATPEERRAPFAAQDGGLPFDPRATRGPASPPPPPVNPGRASASASASPTASRSPSARPSASASVSTAPPASPTTTAIEASTCKVSYSKQEWNGGFNADITVTNTGTAPVSGWSLRFDYPAGQQVTGFWNATVSQSASSVLVRTDGNNKPVIGPGESMTFGVQGTWTGTNPAPSAFTLNGAACA